MKKTIFLLGALLIMSGHSYAKLEKIILAGGCFWCVESDFDKLPGVTNTVSGFDGGAERSPSYDQVSSGDTKYIEVVEITFDTDKISLEQVLDYFWRHVDPTHGGGQFCDRGPQYRTAIFYKDTAQETIARKSKADIEALFNKSGLRIQTEILPSTNFTPAEEYHQNYAENNTLSYTYYRWRCRRDQTLEKLRKQVWNANR